MAFFLSSFFNKIDKKGRVSVPSQFRTSLGRNNYSIIIYPSFVNDCIEGCDFERIKKLHTLINKLDPFSEERDVFATNILASAIQLSIDKDGRVIPPTNILSSVGIDNSILFVGKGDIFEIWNPEKFEKYKAKVKVKSKDFRNLLKNCQIIE